MTTDNFYFYLQNRLIQTSQTGGQRYSDTSPFSIPWMIQQWIGHVSFYRVDQITVGKMVFGEKTWSV
jgi:hypothetical protein